MRLTFEKFLKVLPLVKSELYNGGEISFFVQTSLVKDVLTILKTHFLYQFKILTCISGVDYPENLYRFQIVYEILSVKYNSRIRLKIVLDELTPVDSCEQVYPAATWWECEIWDMLGVFFRDQYNLTRLLTDYGFQGFPLRKDFPLAGFIEARFNFPRNRVAYESVELTQEYRTFEYLSPWENHIK